MHASGHGPVRRCEQRTKPGRLVLASAATRPERRPARAIPYSADRAAILAAPLGVPQSPALPVWRLRFRAAPPLPPRNAAETRLDEPHLPSPIRPDGAVAIRNCGEDRKRDKQPRVALLAADR